MQAAYQGAPLGSSYRLVEPVGEGAVGTVWTATRSDTSALFAAKLLKPEYADSPEFLERFVRERTVLMQLQHSSIVPVVDMIVEGGNLAIIMEYQHGGTLRDMLRTLGTIAPGTALAMMERVLLALEQAHRKKVLHLDIKPDNVLLSGNPTETFPEQVRVADFGIAELTGDGPASSTTGRGSYGTPMYMSPERKHYGTAAESADVYSVGVMLHELLIAYPPTPNRGNPTGVHESIPNDLRTALEAMLATSPDARPTAAQAAASLRALAARYAPVPPMLPVNPPSSPQHTPPGTGPGERMATVVRGASAASQDTVMGTQMPVEPLPHLGEASSQTVLRPVRVSPEPEQQAQEEEEEEPTGGFTRQLRRPIVWGSILSVLLIVVVIGVVIWNPVAPKKTETTHEKWSAQGNDSKPLPSGLGTQVSAEYDSSSQSASLTFKFSSQKSALKGDILQVIPGTAEGGTCPETTWSPSKGQKAQKNHATITGIDKKCSWSLPEVEIPANSTVSMTATVKVSISDQKDLQKWVSEIERKTQEAITDREVQSTSYPLQRLQAIAVKVPDKVVNQSALPITVVPVWPSGQDDVHPILRSPATGDPSQVVQAVAPDQSAVRFTDSCAGHISVSADGKTVTTLSIAPQCTITATVGNYTDIRSNQFSITAR